MRQPLSYRLKALRFTLDEGVPDDLSALDEAIELAERVESGHQPSLLEEMEGSVRRGGHDG